MSYILLFVSRIENDRPFLDDHLEQVFAENPDLPSDELPPLNPLLAVMRSTHLDRVFRFVSGAYWAIEFAHRVLLGAPDRRWTRSSATFVQIQSQQLVAKLCDTAKTDPANV
ncbi:hypothetical protein FRC10_004277 [Ceratobasidium sp. 414]|nr:hypothetical protein FRC10_004277 [Ceratobasidium sp. 414]